MRVQLTTVQGNHKEAMDQLAERGKQIVALKTDLDHMNQQNHAMAEEIAVYEDKMRKLRSELKKMQELNKQSEEEVRDKYNMLC